MEYTRSSVVSIFYNKLEFILAPPPTSAPNLKKTNQKGGTKPLMKTTKKETPSSCYYSQPQ